MVGPPVEFGIAVFGFAFGEDQDVRDAAGTYVSDPERFSRWGYLNFHRAPDGTTATMLAAVVLTVVTGLDYLREAFWLRRQSLSAR